MSGAYQGSTYFRRGGAVYLQSSYTARPGGGATYTYTSGSFFSDKSYSSFSDTYDAADKLTTHVENNKDGSHSIQVDGNAQAVQALGSDTFSDYASSTRFEFNHGFGGDTIYGFQTSGRNHDVVSLPSSEASHLGQILAQAHGDGQGNATIHVGRTDTITFEGVSVADLRAHPGVFRFHA